MIRTLAVSMRKAVIVLSLAALGSAVTAQDFRFRDGRFLETLGGVTLQRADEASSDEAVRNMPFLPGDRVWTDDAGRAEIVFADGEVLWIAERSKVDSLGRGGRDQDERLGLRVFAGSFGARVRSEGPGFEFHAPGGTITTAGAAWFRVDVRAGETVLSVSEGELLADLGGERMTVRAGERVRYADRAIDGPFRYSRAGADEFDTWCDERNTELDRMARSRDDGRLPSELNGYRDELDRNGDWVYDEPQGYVYVPRVAYDWAPYTYGRWVYTLYGWTWVADEPWGFATSHYGRWGYSSRIGWHWLPRAGFAGAWVSWSTPVGNWSRTIGWCALGFNDRPVSSFAYGSIGRAVSTGDSRAISLGRGWSFANREDMGRANIHRRRVDIPAEDAQRAVVWNPNSSPDRDFHETRRGAENQPGRASVGDAVGAVSRQSGRDAGGRGDGAARVYVRPSPGDSTPELRSDPATTIPTPESRRGRAIGQDGFKDEQDNRRSRRRDDGAAAIDESGSTGGQDSTHSKSNDRGAAGTGGTGGTSSGAARIVSPNDTSRADTQRDHSIRDPLLSRFFRSITSPSAERDPARDANPNRGDEGSAARRREPQAKDDASAKETRPRERERPPAESHPPDRERERPRPSGVERSQPKNPQPQASPKSSGKNDSRSSRQRSRPGL